MPCHTAYHAMSCHISYHTIPHSMSRHIAHHTVYHTMSCHIAYHAMPYSIPCYATCHKVPCHNTPCHKAYPTMQFHATHTHTKWNECINVNGFKYFQFDINICGRKICYVVFRVWQYWIEMMGLSVFDKSEVLFSQEKNRKYPSSLGHSSRQIAFVRFDLQYTLAFLEKWCIYGIWYILYNQSIFV